MTTFALIVAIAALGTGLSRWVRLPLAPAVLLTALLCRLLPLPLEAADVETALVLSATFLVFALGAWVDPRGAARGQPALLVLGKLVVLGGLATAASLAAGFDAQSALWMGLALASSSSMTATEMLRRRERAYEPVGRILTGGLLAHDGATVVLLSLLVVGARGVMDLGGAALGFAALAGLASVTTRWIAPALLYARDADDEQQLLTVLAVLAAFLAAALLAGLPLVTGAFFAGLSLAPFPSGGIVRGHVGAFRDFFLPLFLASLGTLVTLPERGELLVVIVAVVAILIVQPMLMVPLGRRAGLTLHEAVEGSLLLATSGELALIVAITGTAEGRIDDASLRVVAAVAVVTMGLLPWTSSRAIVRGIVEAVPSRAVAIDPALSGHVVVIGCGAHTRTFVERLHAEGIGVVVVDHDPDVIARLEALGIACVRGDGRSARDLARAGAASARAFVSTLPDRADTQRLVQIAGGKPVWARVFDPAAGAALAAVGADPIVAATAAAEDFLVWFEDWDLTAPRA